MSHKEGLKSELIKSRSLPCCDQPKGVYVWKVLALCKVSKRFLHSHKEANHLRQQLKEQVKQELPIQVVAVVVQVVNMAQVVVLVELVEQEEVE